MREKVTIIIPVFRNIFFLKKSFSSAVNQTYKNIEIIIVSDGNTKKDLIKIKTIINKNKKTKLFVLHKNKGVSNALNLGIKHSKGSYISWLSHDDYYHPDKIKKQLQFLKKTKAKICSCNFLEINHIKKFRKIRKISNGYFYDANNFFIIDDSLHGCSLLLEKSCFNNILFDKKLKHIQDYDVWVKLASKFTIVHLNKTLLYSIQHKKQSSVLKINESKNEKTRFYKFLLENRICINNLSYLKYILKFIYRSIFQYNSIIMFLLIIYAFIFYPIKNFYQLYFAFNKKNFFKL